MAKIFNLILFLILIVSLSAEAQLNNNAFIDPLTIDSTKKNNLYIGINTMGFMKDNEYFNKIADGYTLYGYQFNLKVIYFPARHVRIEGGVFLWKDFGNPNYTQIAPTFTIKIKKDSLSFLFGTLQGSLSHRLVEPMYNFERVIYDRLENGMQVIYNRRRFWIDGWLLWDRMQYKYDKEQEQIWGGFSSIYKPIIGEKFELGIPIQATAKHIGGQIDVNPNPLTTLFNSAIGISPVLKFRPEGFISSVRIDNYFLSYKDFSFVKQRPFKAGYGLYFNLSVYTKLMNVMVSYWEGHDYYAIRGGDLYQSVSSNISYPGYVEPERHLLILRFLKDINVMDGMVISTRVEPFYDILNKKTNFSMGLYLNFRHEVFIAKIKKR